MIAVYPQSIERTAREGWIDLRLALPASDDPEFAWTLLGKNGSLFGPARFERYDAGRMGIGVQVREDGPGNPIETALEAIREAERALHGKPDAEPGTPRPDEKTDWPGLGAERGWAITRRDDGRIAAELDAIGVMNQGFLETRGDRALLALTVLRTAGLNDLTREAVARFVLGLTAPLRLVRAALSTGETETLRFEVPLPSPVSATDLDHGLEALSLAARLGGRECRALMDEPLARRYLAST
jgi:hypothetical protein